MSTCSFAYRNSKLETRNSKCEMRNAKCETPNSKLTGLNFHYRVSMYRRYPYFLGDPFILCIHRSIYISPPGHWIFDIKHRTIKHNRYCILLSCTTTLLFCNLNRTVLVTASISFFFLLLLLLLPLLLPPLLLLPTTTSLAKRTLERV